MTAVSRPATRQVKLRLIRDAEHHSEVVESGILRAKTSIWIATANLKDVHVEAPRGTAVRARSKYVSLFGELLKKANAGIEVRLLSAGAPSRVLASRIGVKSGAVQMRRCPRVHLKMVAIDGELLYLGSANLTGAGLGAKSAQRRNFEAGIVTDCPLLLDELQGYFDAIWSGKHCKTCRLRANCPAPLDCVIAKAPAEDKKAKSLRRP